ncbi:MAG TPA: amino acid adenylation domain-containing protein [Terriglobales bacterium]|nr:amino acid adenylation domain-containing protein [Terriglobales bacterium]
MGNSVTAGFRLSAQQERVWAQRAGAAVACAIEIQSSVDPVKLQESLKRLVRRHEILRTVFHRQAGLKLPFQVIREFLEPAWTTAKAADGHALMQETLDAPFDLETGPMLRAVLVQSEEGAQTLILSLPALCADARSLRNLVHDLALEYSGEAPAADAMQYADVVEWQNELLESEDTRAGREYWRNYFRGLDLSSVRLESPFADVGGASHLVRCEITLERALSDQIDTFCRTRDLTARDLLLSCWIALWARLNGRQNLTIGCSFDGRKYQELEDAIGVFANSIPIHSPVAPEARFDALANQVKRALAEAHSWQESFAWSKVESWPEPNLQIVPLAFEDYDISGAEGPFRLQEVSVDLERCELKLVAVRSGSGLRLEVHYDGGRFSRSAVERIAGYFQTLLAGALAAPETLVSRLPLLPEAERRKLLVEWNQTAAPYPQDRCLHQLFESQAARTPDRPALVFGEQTLRFAEWNQQANQLAHYLRSLGVGPDSLVGLCLDRSAEMMIALLGILKAGGAYVPLNPDNPKPRLAQQLAGAVALITESKLIAQMPQFSGHTLCLGRDEKLWADQPVTNPDTRTSPDNLVYVIYTSGSTGVPKGVAVRHRNLVNYSHFITQRLGLANDPEGLHFATVSTIGADLGNTCIFPAMISGGCLHVIPYEVSTDAQRLARYTEAHPIDVLKIVPSHLEALLHSSEAAQILPRKFLLTGGETLTPKLVETILALHPGCELFNHYGPTETTVGSLTLRLKEYDWKKSPAHSIPIGRPIANTQVYILDAHLEPVPEGVIGELYIAGAGVTAGYLNQPEKTQERFLRNPFVSDANARMYRTGDVARYLAEGNIEFLGRGDDQVKIRGFRIELGEIEAVLAQHAGVKQAVVLAKADERGDKRLVAYAVAREADLSADTLRAYLKEQLPDYMVPQAIVLLQKLPLNANGKIDRQALPEPEQVTTKAYVAPATPTEQAVAQIWSEVLRRDRISTQDNFFDLGGHSLMATQVVSRIRRTLHIDLPLRVLFEQPTVRQISEQIAKLQEKSAPPALPPIVRVPRDQPLPLSFAQQRLWVLDQMEPNNPLYNIPRTLRMIGELNIAALEKSIHEILRRHESQRTRFGIKDGQPVQLITPDARVALTPQNLSAVPEPQRESEARRIAAEEALLPFDLGKGPLVRARLLRLSPADHVLLLTMHHVVSDAWSAAIALQELSALYEAFAGGKPSPLAELPVQYGDYAAWQRQHFRGAVLDQQLSYWRKQLAGAPPLLQLPTDRPRPEVRSFQGALELIPLSAELSRLLKAFSQQAGVTLFMTLLAGFQTLLFRYSAQEQIVLGTDVANRTTTETERMIGFFINLLALRTDLSGNPTFRELLERVREVALGAYAHQDMPFDKLVEELQPERALSHNPLVQALFVMQNIPREKQQLANLKLQPFEMPITRSKFDLAVFMVEGESGLTGQWLYSTDLFERSTILRLARNFETLLGNAIRHPNGRLDSLEILTDQERQQADHEKKQRKQSQLKKLMKIEPKAATLAEAGAKDKE